MNGATFHPDVIREFIAGAWFTHYDCFYPNSPIPCGLE